MNIKMNRHLKMNEQNLHRVVWIKISSLCFFFILTINSKIGLSADQISVIKLTAQEIANKASLSAYYGGEDGRTLARMKIVDSNGRKQYRQFTILRKDLDDGGEQKYLLVFSRPTDVKGTVFMVHKKPLLDDDRWLYLPALDLVKRISAGDKRTSFVGTHYFYEDISGRAPNEDLHEILEETDKFYILKHTPKKTEGVEFNYYKTWIDKNNFLPMIVEFVDRNNKSYRKIESVNVVDIQGIPTVTEAKVTNLIDMSYTLLEFKNSSYNLELPDSLFTEKSLRNPPAKWLKTKK